MNMLSREPASEATRKSAPRGIADILGITAAINMLRRRMWLITFTAITAAIATFALLMLQPRVYNATALLILNQPATSASGQMTPVDAEIALLRSPALMNELATALGMQGGASETPGLADNLAGAITVQEQRRNTGIIEITARSGEAQRAQLMANTYADVYLASQVNLSAGAALTENS